jgi:hypothetical protein
MDKIDTHSSTRRWLAAALAVACAYSAMALRLAFASRDLIQDDARQHIFWMARFRDPTLFPNDLIANYFQAVAPAGYKAIYWILAKCGVDPLLFSKMLPAAIGLLTAYLAFQFFLRLTADARGAFFASVLMCQLIWFKDDVVSATPRAFVYPLFLAFLLFLVDRRLILCLLMLTLEGLIYPQAAFVSEGVLVLRLLKWKDRHVDLSRDRADYALAGGGLLLLAIVLIAFASSISTFGPVISRDEALVLPEFLRHGRSQFFTGGIDFWVTSARSGFWPNAIPAHVIVLAFAGLVLLVARLKSGAVGQLFLSIALSAIGLWAAAHLFLFKLHLPARYSQWPVRILVALMAAFALGAICKSVGKWRAQFLPVVVLVLSGLLVVFPIFAKNFPYHSYVKARPKALFEFLRSQPKNVVIATLRESANSIPVFAQRSVLVSAEHAIPYHTGYYREIRERGRDLVQAHFTSHPDELRAFIEKYHVDLIVIGRKPTKPAYIKKLRWFREIAAVREMTERYEVGERPVLANFAERCKIWENKGNVVLDAHLIAQMIERNETPASP